MPTPLVERALAEIARRLATVLTTGGYNTDGGAHVFRAQRTMDIGDLPGFVVWKQSEQDPSPDSDGSDKAGIVVTISVECHVRAGQDETGEAIELLVADAKQAVLRDCEFGLNDAQPKTKAGKLGPIRKIGVTTSQRETGSTSEAQSIEFAVTLIEGVGNPYGPTTEDPS